MAKYEIGKSALHMAAIISGGVLVAMSIAAMVAGARVVAPWSGILGIIIVIGAYADYRQCRGERRSAPSLAARGVSLHLALLAIAALLVWAARGGRL